MGIECCKLTSQLDCFPYCLTSISNNISTELNTVCAPEFIIKGPTIGNLSISGYALDHIYTGCPAKASVSLTWVRKYDCEYNKNYFIFQRGGQASVIAPTHISDYVTLHNEQATGIVMSANVGGGPVSMYTYDTEHIGFGLTYRGTPIQFTTETADNEGVILRSTSFCGITAEAFYLTNFSVDYSPGEVPIASYSFIYPITTASVEV